MSDATLKRLAQDRLAFLKGIDVVKPNPPEPQGNTTEGLPPAASQDDVDTIERSAIASKVSLDFARKQLQSPSTLPTKVDWSLSLYNLFVAWIVNFGLDPEREAARAALKAGDLDGAATHLAQQQQFIVAAAGKLGLEWIPFVDLALVAIDDSDAPASGPFGGVFIDRGLENGTQPYMILAFKGTTYAMEVATDKLLKAVLPDPSTPNVLYGERSHQGMHQGLFKAFPNMNNQKAFDIILSGLNSVANDLKSDKYPKIPLYLTGHSLGAGYATLAYIELIRGYKADGPFTLHDLWTFGSPRVGLNELAKRVKGLLQGSSPVRNIWRIARNGDGVPTVPNLPFFQIGAGWIQYKHLDIGYKLTPGQDTKVTERPSEIDEGIVNDLVPIDFFFYHWPPMYYEGIKAVLERFKPI